MTEPIKLRLDSQTIRGTLVFMECWDFETTPSIGFTICRPRQLIAKDKYGNPFELTPEELGYWKAVASAQNQIWDWNK